MKKYCKCGCGDTVKNEWSKGHYSRVHNNWGHNPTAIENSAILKSFVKDENSVKKVVDYHIYSKVSGVVLCKTHHKEQHPSLNL
ncbi:hypothetical protein HOE22_08045 [Candidatus Woesearchaeota archaeon]|jgi:hypothetical protein|nr:hypothetical protein [Candidatus Woesearchaeota archaeon]